MIHRKHAKLVKPIGGLFHRNELALIGAPCDRIQYFVDELRNNRPELNLAYADAAHGVVENDYTDRYQDQIEAHLVQFKGSFYNKRNVFQSYAGVLINGNHFKGENQIVFLNPKKKESLSKKVDRLTNVKLIIQDGEEELYDFLTDVPGINEVEVLNIDNVEGIVKWIIGFLKKQQTALIGCVFTGGKSTRMGTDKAMIDYHGMKQYQFVNEQFNHLEIPSFLSVANNENDFESENTLKDEFIGLGPYGGLLTAFKHYPNNAILTCPCDVPLVDSNLLKKLIEERDSTKIATCFYNPETKFPEPLITLWESHAYAVLLDFLSLGYSCPRKVLINSDINMIKLEGESYKLMNANSPEDKKEIESLLKQEGIA